MSVRPWRITRLLQWFLKGRGSEHLIGDLAESWRTLATTDGRGWRVQLAHLHDVARTVAWWWKPENVRRRARATGGRDQVRDTWQRRGMGISRSIHALRTALRGLLRRPGFTAITVLTLGLGIGATTTILSVVDGVILRPLPYDREDELVAVGATFPGREWVEGTDGLQHLAGVSVGNLGSLRERSRTLERIAGLEIASYLLPDEGEGPRLAPMARVTDEFFETMGVGVELGRLFAPDEFGGGAVPPVLLSWSTWRTRFGGDPSIVGRTLPAREGGAAPTIVGVLAADFVPPENLGAAAVEFWQPLDPDNLRYESRGNRSLSLLGRLAPGASIESARAELEEIASELAREFPEGSVYPDGTWLGYGVNGLRDDIVGTAKRPLGVFFGASALLLLISAMNSANLLLVRTSERVGELSIRRALGAGRSVLAAHVVMESLLLAAAGGLVGVVLAFVGVELFTAMSPPVPRMDAISVDGRVLLLATTLSLGVGVLIGLVPAAGVARRDPARVLRSNRAGSGGGSRAGFRNALVAAQLAVALLLGIGASTLMHSFVRVSAVDPGFEPEGLVSFRLSSKRPGGPVETWGAWDETLGAVQTVGGITDAAGVSNLPFEDPNWAPGFRFPGDAEEEVRTGIAGYAITPGYFETIGQELVRGRDVLASDGPDATPVAVVNRALVERDFKGVDPIGATILLTADAVEFRVVGVVEDAVVRRAEEGPQPAIYIPYTQIDWPWIKIVVRTPRDFAAIATDLRQAAATISPIVPVQDMVSLGDRIRSVETEPRFQAWLITTFASAALLLATVGLYGTLAHTVGRRQREIGVRLALGAAPGAIFGMILRQGAFVAAAGGVVGGGVAVLAGRVLERFLFEVPPVDPVAFVVGLAALAAATLCATLRPAFRAKRVDVVGSIRSE